VLKISMSICVKCQELHVDGCQFLSIKGEIQALCCQIRTNDRWICNDGETLICIFCKQSQCNCGQEPELSSLSLQELINILNMYKLFIIMNHRWIVQTHHRIVKVICIFCRNNKKQCNCN
jgi:hypothetical protein